MGEIIDSFTSRKGRPPIYDWDTWADGQARRLYQGQDFNATLFSFRTMVHRKARDLNMTAQTRINEADNSIQVQFHPKRKKR